MAKRYNAEKFALAVQLKRKMCDLSRKELGVIVSVNERTIMNVEGGEHAPDIATFAALCDWLDLSPNEFFTEQKTR